VEKDEKQSKSGFTLVELLVVISIIAILLAVLMPSLSKAREQARSTVCKSHIKQLTLAASLWSEDHDGYVVAGMWYVPAKSFSNDTSAEADLANKAIQKGTSLEKYTASNESMGNSLYSCPTATKFGKDLFYITTSYYANAGANRIATTSYGVNSFAVMYDGDDKYLGIRGTTGTGNGGTYEDWGPDDTYMLEHGKSKVLQIQGPSTKVYFSDFSYMQIYDWMYSPIKVYYQLGASGIGQRNYVPIESLALVPAGGKVVQSRWHGTVNKKTGYGYSNMGWFDGSVSREPEGFGNSTRLSGGGSSPRYAWQQYFYVTK